MKSQIETNLVEAINNNDVQSLWECCESGGLEGTFRHHKFELDAFGTVFFDDVNDPTNPGWVVQDLDGGSRPVDNDELADELIELLEMI